MGPSGHATPRPGCLSGRDHRDQVATEGWTRLPKGATPGGCGSLATLRYADRPVPAAREVPLATNPVYPPNLIVANDLNHLGVTRRSVRIRPPCDGAMW